MEGEDDGGGIELGGVGFGHDTECGSFHISFM